MCFWKRKKPLSPPNPKPPEPVPGPLPGPAPVHRLVNCRGQGFWSHDKGQDAGIDQIPLMAPMANIFWQKYRYPLHDPGPGWLICLEASKDLTLHENADFLLEAQRFYGLGRIVAATIHDEPDTDPDYNPNRLDLKIMDLRHLGVDVPMGVNLSLGWGLEGGVGAPLVHRRGVPFHADVVFIEGYWILADRYQQVMLPNAILPTLKIVPKHQKIVVVGVAYADYNQPDPGYEEVMCSWRAWNTDPRLSAYAPRVAAYIHYRWRNDPGAEDCRVAAEDLPEVQRAVKEMADLTGWRVGA